jgi:Na+(H+)/acetate symporter ActP
MLWYPVGFAAGYLALLLFVAAPLRRSGAFTLPDFCELRLGSKRLRKLATGFVVFIGWLYLVPQLQGAGLTLSTLTGAPFWVGSLLVGAVVTANVAFGGMRAITFVQAFQYWLKLTALLIPAVFLLLVWFGDGAQSPADPVFDLAGQPGWGDPLSGLGEHPMYTTYSIVIATFLGTMGLPHVVVRFYTNPDGRAARRTTLVVLALLGLFYVLPPVYGALGRMYAGDLVAAGRADSVVLELPTRMVGGTGGELLAALLVAGAFAAFLSTSSGLTIAVAGVLSQDLMSRWLGGISSFRVGAALGVGVAYMLAVLADDVGVATAVGLAFAVAASTFCPLLVLGIWWRRLTDVGAIAGLVVGGTTSGFAVVRTFVTAEDASWGSTLLAQPAAWTVPLAFTAMVLGSLLTPGRRPVHATRFMVRLHTPEAVGVDRG